MSVVAALLSACGGSSIPRASDNTASDAAAPKNSKTFHYTGSEQTFKVPAGVKQLAVVALGGEGAGFSTYPSTDTPGRPGRGGSSYVEPAAITSRMWMGWRSFGDGQIIFSWK
jgi:hypothetical protein